MRLSPKAKFFTILAMVLLIVAGAAIAIYPLFATAYAERVRSEIKVYYDGAVDNSNAEQLAQYRREAEAWNSKLFSGKISPLEPDSNGYYDVLNLPNTEIMGFVRIPSIGVDLPIYHSIADDVLSNGVGHLPQSSLPVGGVNTHTVLSAHSGLSSGPMFSNLEQMAIGDKIYIDILGETLVYQVYEIPEPVLPADISSVQIQRGKDLCTLVTCTPYGVNSHRLLIHAERITLEDPDPAEAAPVLTEQEDSPESVWLKNYWRSLVFGAVLCVLLVSFADGISFDNFVRYLLKGKTVVYIRQIY